MRHIEYTGGIEIWKLSEWFWRPISLRREWARLSAVSAAGRSPVSYWREIAEFHTSVLPRRRVLLHAIQAPHKYTIPHDRFYSRMRNAGFLLNKQFRLVYYACFSLVVKNVIMPSERIVKRYYFESFKTTFHSAVLYRWRICRPICSKEFIIAASSLALGSWSMARPW